MTTSLNRRAFCGKMAGGAALAVLGAESRSVAADPADGLTLSIGNYGLPSRRVEDAIRLIAAAGFDGLELSVMPGYDSAPAKLSEDRRRTIRQLLEDHGLALTSLMELLPPSADGAEQKRALDRLQAAADLGKALSPHAPPLIQTVLGGGSWEEKKGLYVDCLGDWQRLAESNQTVIGIKPHRGGAMSEPAQAVWLLDQLKASAWMGMVYDYSHYALRNLSIAETVKVAYPKTVHLVVKDVLKKGEQVEFALPGETGTIDFREILTRFYDLGYRKDVCCEVSGQIFGRAGYDAEAATKTCYQNMNRVFEAANLPRRRPRPARS